MIASSNILYIVEQAIKNNANYASGSSFNYKSDYVTKTIRTDVYNSYQTMVPKELAHIDDAVIEYMHRTMMIAMSALVESLVNELNNEIRAATTLGGV